MISEEELKNIMAVEGINCFNASITMDSFEKSLILLDENTMDELIRFVKLNNIKNVFCTYSFYDDDYFIIDEELMDEFDSEYNEEFDEEIYSVISKGIEEHNKQIEKLDLSRPVEVHIFCIYETRYIAINDYDFWCDKLGIISAKEKIQDLIKDNSDTIDRKKKERRLNNQVLKVEFKNYVLNDNEFKNCTNQKLRSDYMHLIFQREENNKYKIVFQDMDGSLNHCISVNFIEMLWREYKSQK